MKKYRFDDLSKRTLFQRARPFILMFISWNLIGFLTWRVLNEKAASRDPMFASRTEGERIAIMAGAKPESLKKYEFKLFGSSKKEEKS